MRSARARTCRVLLRQFRTQALTAFQQIDATARSRQRRECTAAAAKVGTVRRLHRVLRWLRRAVRRLRRTAAAATTVAAVVAA